MTDQSPHISPVNSEKGDSQTSFKSCRFSANPLTPIVTIIPPTLPDHRTILTPPLTPKTPLTPCLKNSGKTTYFPTTSIPINPYTDLENLYTPPGSPSSYSADYFDAPFEISPPSVPDDTAHSLQDPLITHLSLLHPHTPKEVIKYCAVHLLSKEKPYGFKGEWEPLYHDIGDLTIAGLGMEASKGLKQKGKGREEDEKLEEMYAVVRDSWSDLERVVPQKNCAL